MATITTTISPIPDAGHRGIDARTEFVNKQEAFQDALTDVFVSQINSFGTEVNLVRSEVNSLRDATATDKNTATTQAGIATTKASEANTSANQALTYKNQVMGYVVPSGASYSVEQINTQNVAMTKAQFNALAEERKANRAGSGFDEVGRYVDTGNVDPINEGMMVNKLLANVFYLGYNAIIGGPLGTAKTDYPIININGAVQKIDRIETTYAGLNVITIPTAPNDETLLSRSDLIFPESFHEDVSEKNFVYPFGNIHYLGSNTDGLTGIANGSFTGYETYSLYDSWQTAGSLIGKGYVWSNLTEVQKKAFISNPDNNCYLDGDKTIQVRYRMRVIQGVGDTTSMANATVQGKSIIPSSTLYTAPTSLDRGLYSNTSTTYGYDGRCFAIPLALVHRRNQGMYHPVYNANGTKKASDDKNWYETTVSFTSVSDCFNPDKLLTASGYIGSVSGRPDGLSYDQIHEGDILDLRSSSKKVEDYNRLISREFSKLVAGTTRGKEGEWTFKTTTFTPTSVSTTSALGLTGAYLIGTVIGTELGNLLLATGAFNSASPYYNGLVYIKGNDGNLYRIATFGTGFITTSPVGSYNNSAGIGQFTANTSYEIIVGTKTTRTKSNTLLHCDIIGSPSNYPIVWKTNGVFGTPLLIAEDGTSLLPDGVLDSFKLSRKANATPLLYLRSTDNGVTWTRFIPTFSTATNEITLTNEPAENLVMVYYQTKTSMAVPVANSEVLEIGDVLGTNGLANGALISTLIGKVPTANTTPYLQMGYDINGYRIDMSTFKFSTIATEIPTHSPLSLAGGAVGVPAVKVLPYLTRLNGKAYLNLVFKEMKHNGTSWGDSNKFEIVDNVSTTTDNNAQTVLIGQKTVGLNVFIGADE